MLGEIALGCQNFTEDWKLSYKVSLKYQGKYHWNPNSRKQQQQNNNEEISHVGFVFILSQYSVEYQWSKMFLAKRTSSLPSGLIAKTGAPLIAIKQFCLPVNDLSGQYPLYFKIILYLFFFKLLIKINSFSSVELPLHFKDNPFLDRVYYFSGCSPSVWNLCICHNWV